MWKLTKPLSGHSQAIKSCKISASKTQAFTESDVLGPKKTQQSQLLPLVFPPLPGFSPNLSSAGKGTFMDGKAKNIYFSRKGGGGGGSGVRDMDPALTGKFFYSHILRPILHKSAVVLSLDNKLKCLIPIILLCL